MSTNKIDTVVVGVDGSQESAAAVAWAEKYAESTGATLRLVSVWQWANSYGVPMRFDGYDPARDAQAMADKARANVSLGDDRVNVVVVEGQPGPVLVNESDGAIALVVGSRGHGKVSTLLLGSVSSYCLHHAECPVVIIR